jgi:DNA polymerase-3 subunit alpha
MEICKQLCGYTGGQADEMRKAVGKKKQKLMDKHKPMFTEGWVKSGLSANSARQLWDDIVRFAAYGFNRSHAAAYAYITYQTAYLKAHYPTEFLCAVMTCVGKKDKDHLIRCLTDCKKQGISVLPPDSNDSNESFSVTGDQEIRFGIGPIKNIGAGAATILEEREMEGDFSSMRDFCERVSLGIINRKKLESLILAGAFDTFGQNRQTMMNAVETIWKYREDVKKYESKMKTYEKKESARLERLREIEEGTTKKKPFKQWAIPEEVQWPEIIEYDEMPDIEIQTNEHGLLGFFVSSHPLDSWDGGELSDRFNTIEDIQEMDDGARVSFAGVVTQLKEITTKSMKKMAFPMFEDLTGSIETTVFSNIYTLTREILQEPRPMRVDGIVDVVEGDDGARTTKVMVKKISALSFQDEVSWPIEARVPVKRVGKLLSLIDENYTGDIHEVKVSGTLADGTVVKVPDSRWIANRKGAFMREVARFNNEQ